ncbi:hypothetical protein ACLB2K_060900 [Fragaria x ananassa]
MMLPLPPLLLSGGMEGCSCNTKGLLAMIVDSLRDYAETKSMHVEFKEGDLVLVKLLPQQFKSLRKVHKGLVRKYEGSFEVIKRIGNVSYKLHLPAQVEDSSDLPRMEVELEFDEKQMECLLIVGFVRNLEEQDIVYIKLNLDYLYDRYEFKHLR